MKLLSVLLVFSSLCSSQDVRIIKVDAATTARAKAAWLDWKNQERLATASFDRWWKIKAEAQKRYGTGAFSDDFTAIVVIPYSTDSATLTSGTLSLGTSTSGTIR